MSEERDGDEDSAGVGGDSWACGENDGGTGGLFRSGAAEARGVTERDLEAASAVNSRTDIRIRHTHTRRRGAVGKPTGSRGSHNWNGAGPRESRSALRLRDERCNLGRGAGRSAGLRDEGRRGRGAFGGRRGERRGRRHDTSD